MKNYIRLPLRNAPNVRDIGGYACSGGVTAWHKFLRGDNLERLERDEIDFLKDYGVRLVIDLRSDKECETAPDPFAHEEGVRYVQIPLITDITADISMVAVDGPEQFMNRFYIGVLRDSREGLRRVLSELAAESEGAALFHCMGGKDRTGLVAMLIMGLAGVSEADIIANYQVSFTYIIQDPRVQQIIEKYSEASMASRREYIMTALNYIASEFDSISDYVRAIGVTEAEISAICSKICE